MANTDLKTRFFDFDEKEKVYKCKVNNCKGKLKDNFSSIKRHLAHCHPDIAEKTGIAGYSRSRKDGQQSQQSQSTVSPSPAKRLKTVSVQVDPTKFHTGIIRMVSEKSISFNFFNSQACGDTIGILAKGLNIPVYGEAVASSVSRTADIIRDMIATDLEHFFCLEFDGAVRHNRKIFGINARILKNGMLLTKTLAMMEIEEKQTGHNLKCFIEKVLKKYNTNVKHVYSCTTDNGRNMIKCSQELRDCQEKALSVDIDVSVDVEDRSENEEIDIEAEKEVDDMLQAVESIYLNGNESCISSVKCAAHTINLVAKDAVNETNEILCRVRNMVKACRKNEYRPFFEISKVSLPKIDVETRWGSQFEMIESVHAKKGFFEDMGQKFPNFNWSVEEWDYIEEYTEAFEPLFALTKSLQGNRLILGDVFKLFKMCHMKISQVSVNNRFTESIKRSLERRMLSMMDNDAFRAALLFDQRRCFIDSPYMSTDDKLSAIEHMLKVSNILKTFNKNNTNQVQQPSNQNEIPRRSEDAFEELLQEECKRASASISNSSQVDLKLKLLKLANSKTRLPANTDILLHWESRRYEDEELYELAMVALSTAATEVSVERCFSGIKLLLEQHRLRMSSSTLDDLMILRQNKDLLQSAIERIYNE